MPQPVDVTGAFFVAAVAAAVETAEGFEPLGDSPRFITLELGIKVLPHCGRTVMCEWLPNGDHLNYGVGPAPDLESFLGAILRLLETEGGKTP
jgi:hypothetical protein